MNRRLFTIINAGIALVTVGAVIFDLTRTRTGPSRHQRQQTTAQAKSASDQAEKPQETIHIKSPDDLANMRVDDLGAVPAAELTHIMTGATPEQLAALAKKFNEAPTDARTFGGMGIFFQAWAQLDPKSALANAFLLNDVGMRKLAATTVVKSVSPSAAPELIAFITKTPDKDLADECGNDFLADLVSGWSSLDPEAASKFMDDLGDSHHSMAYRTRGAIAYNWGTLDPSAALKWIESQKGKDYVASDLSDDVISGWCRADLNSAAAYVAQHPDESTAATVIGAMFEHNSIDQATTWASQMPAGAARKQANATIASMWAEKDPASAAKWLATIPADEQQNGARTIARNWVNTNWEDASRWIATLSGDARDGAVAAAVKREAATETESLSLALSIGNDKMRNESVENIIRYWSANNAAAAETWIQGSPLSDEQREHMRSIVSETRKNAEENAEVERVITD